MSITESTSNYQDLDKKNFQQLLLEINQEDHSVPASIKKNIGAIEKACEEIFSKMQNGGRLFYIGAGTSGRLGVVDASECPPTFGVDHETVIGIIAGGDKAIRKAVEFAEDDEEQAWKDLSKYRISKNDVVIGIAASGRTPYVIGGVKTCRQMGISTCCIVCNPNSELAKSVDFPIEIVVGPEYVTGSTRMKAGTAQKLVLNMISTSVMIKLGRVKGNRMVDMQLSNDKLTDRGTKMVAESTGLAYDRAHKLLQKHKSVRKAIEAHQTSTSAD